MPNSPVASLHWSAKNRALVYVKLAESRRRRTERVRLAPKFAAGLARPTEVSFRAHSDYGFTAPTMTWDTNDRAFLAPSSWRDAETGLTVSASITGRASPIDRSSPVEARMFVSPGDMVSVRVKVAAPGPAKLERVSVSASFAGQSTQTRVAPAAIAELGVIEVEVPMAVPAELEEYPTLEVNFDLASSAGARVGKIALPVGALRFETMDARWSVVRVGRGKATYALEARAVATGPSGIREDLRYTLEAIVTSDAKRFVTVAFIPRTVDIAFYGPIPLAADIAAVPATHRLVLFGPKGARMFPWHWVSALAGGALAALGVPGLKALIGFLCPALIPYLALPSTQWVFGRAVAGGGAAAARDLNLYLMNLKGGGDPPKAPGDGAKAAGGAPVTPGCRDGETREVMIDAFARAKVAAYFTQSGANGMEVCVMIEFADVVVWQREKCVDGNWVLVDTYEDIKGVRTENKCFGTIQERDNYLKTLRY